MENIEIAAVFRELADLLEIQGANPFRIRAYRTAVQTISGLSRSLGGMVEDGEDLTELPGIGKDLAGAIEELLATGRLERLEELGKEVPRELVTLMALEGVGPKKAKALWQELDIVTIDDLESAVKDGRVESLSGFGKKSAAKILHSISEHRLHQGRVMLSEADQLVAPLLDHLRAALGVGRIEVAGSCRRRKETIGDLDILAAADDRGAEIIEHFVRFPGVDRVTGAGDTKGSVVLRSGLAVDLRVIPRRSFGAALVYFTGSKEHNIEIRTWAVRHGLRVNEWGVFAVPEGADPDELGKEGGEYVAGKTEEDVYRALEMDWVPPTLRENRGEIKAARKHALPSLVQAKDIRGELHLHSTWSDGRRSIREMAEACQARGYAYCVITDHTPAVGVAGGLEPERVREQWEEIDAVNEALEGFEVFRGLEVDILKDGSLDTTDEVLDGLDFVIVSVHTFMDMDKSSMTDRVLRAMEDPRVDMVGHPTGRKINRREPYPIDMEALLEAAVDLDVAVEINSNPRRLDLSDVHAFRARELGVPVAITTDAHSVKDLELVRYGVDQAQRGWLERRDVLNSRTARQFRTWLRRRDA